MIPLVSRVLHVPTPLSMYYMFNTLSFECVLRGLLLTLLISVVISLSSYHPQPAFFHHYLPIRASFYQSVVNNNSSTPADQRADCVAALEAFNRCLCNHYCFLCYLSCLAFVLSCLDLSLTLFLILSCLVLFYFCLYLVFILSCFVFVLLVLAGLGRSPRSTSPPW